MYTQYEEDKFVARHEVFVQDDMNKLNKSRMEILLDRGGEIISAVGGDTTVIVVKYYIPTVDNSNTKDETKL